MTGPTPTPHKIPASGSLLIGPLTPDAAHPLLIHPPAQATQLVLRALGSQATIEDGVTVTIKGQDIAPDFLPLGDGFWLRLNLPEQTGETDPVHLDLPPDTGLRFVLARATGGRADTPLCFSPIAANLPRPTPVAPAFDAQTTIGHLAALLRDGNADTALSALNRLPNTVHDTVAAGLIEALADDQGETPSTLLPFLMLLARD